MEIIYLKVDRMLPNGSLGETNDMRKVYYNLDLMGEKGRELQQYVNIELLLVERDVTTFCGIGKFICVSIFEKGENRASMSLSDFRLFSNRVWLDIAKEKYPTNYEDFMLIYKEVSSLFSSASDLYKLSVSLF